MGHLRTVTRAGSFASLFVGVVPLAIDLVWSAIAGFSEEITFRGYVQTRFEAAWGTGAGAALTALVFAFVHILGRYLLYSGDVLSALLSFPRRVGIGLHRGFS